MLPRFFRLGAGNKTSAQIDGSSDPTNNKLTVKADLWKIVDGVRTYKVGQTTLFTMAADIAADGYEVGAEFDNSTDLWEGADFTVEGEFDNNSSGSVLIRIENSSTGAATGDYPSDANDFDWERDTDPVKTLDVDASADEHRTTSGQM